MVRLLDLFEIDQRGAAANKDYVRMCSETLAVDEHGFIPESGIAHGKIWDVSRSQQGQFKEADFSGGVQTHLGLQYIAQYMDPADFADQEIWSFLQAGLHPTREQALECDGMHGSSA